jgi:hypothetical protein
MPCTLVSKMCLTPTHARGNVSGHSDHFSILWQGFIKVSRSCGVVLLLAFDRCCVPLVSLQLRASFRVSVRVVAQLHHAICGERNRGVGSAEV